MDFQTAIVLLNVILNAFIIQLDVLVIYAVLFSKELRQNSVLILILLAMFLDILVFINTVAHDIPSYFLDKDVSTKFLTTLSTVILSVQWFSQLLLLPILSVFHLFAVFAPVKFRQINRTDIIICIVNVGFVDILLTAPLFSPYCGYAYFLDGHYWYFDFRKPYTYIYMTINIVLQVLCVGSMIIIDILIVYKIYKLQQIQSWKPSVVSVNDKITIYANKSIRISREMRIALNFVVLTICFLAMTLCFNLIAGAGMWQDALVKLSANLNLAKWAIYSLGNSAVRQRVQRALGVPESSNFQVPSVLTRSNC